MQDKTKLFNSVKLEEIHSVVTKNGRNISDNSLRLMKIDDDVAEVKSITQQIQEDILEMRKLNLEIREISLEMRKSNHEIRLLLDEAIANSKKIREDIDRILGKPSEYRAVGVV